VLGGVLSGGLFGDPLGLRDLAVLGDRPEGEADAREWSPAPPDSCCR